MVTCKEKGGVRGGGRDGTEEWAGIRSSSSAVQYSRVAKGHGAVSVFVHLRLKSGGDRSSSKPGQSTGTHSRSL
jgi:hypothetical protein